MQSLRRVYCVQPCYFLASARYAEFMPRPVNQAGAQGEVAGRRVSAYQKLCMHVAYAFCPAFFAAARRRWLISCQLLRREPPLDWQVSAYTLHTLQCLTYLHCLDIKNCIALYQSLSAIFRHVWKSLDLRFVSFGTSALVVVWLERHLAWKNLFCFFSKGFYLGSQPSLE